MQPELSRLLAVLAALLLPIAAQAQLHTQKTSMGGVTVSVTPKELAAGAPAWNFSVVLDTHSQDLADDVAKNAYLIDERGNRRPAAAWDGAAPGGHHREGVLRFEPLSPAPKTIELRIERANEPAPRIFRWSLP
jgi:hypothetical protein